MAQLFKNTLLVMALLSTLVACAKKEGLRAARGNNGAANGTANDTTPVGTAANCASASQSLGRVYDNGGATGLSFEQRVKGLISALVNPEYFGSISGDPNATANGVTLQGHLSYDSQGNVILDQTHLKLLIYDSFVGQLDSEGKPVEAYPIQFSRASSGSVNLQAKTFSLQFKDSYGEIQLTGSLGASLVTGQMTFQNYSHFDGGAAAAGVLGSFSIPACAWAQ